MSRNPHPAAAKIAFLAQKNGAAADAEGPNCT
jgi:hypothetical protein